MSLVGNLEDLGLGDILQIVSLSRKSGILFINDNDREGKVVFKDGQVIRAFSTDVNEDIAYVLQESGSLDASQAEECLAMHKSSGGGETIDKILLEKFDVSQDTIDDIKKRSIERAAYDLFGWSSGNFNFELKEVEDYVAGDKRDFLLYDHGINPQFIAMEGTRLQDEMKRDQQAAAPAAEVKAKEEVPEVSEPPAPVEEVLPEPVQEEIMGDEIKALHDATVVEKPVKEPSAPVEEVSLDNVKKGIVVIDDDANVLKALKEGLKSDGVDVFVKANTESALHVISKLDSDGASVVVVSDLIMPRMDGTGMLGGIETLEILKGGFPNIPIILMTDHANREAENKAKEMGALAYIDKPKKNQFGDEYDESLIGSFLTQLNDIIKGGFSGKASPPPESGGGLVDLAAEMQDDLASFGEILPEEGDGDSNQPVSSPGISMLKSMIEELNSPEGAKQITLLTLRFASELMNRAVIFLVKNDCVEGLGQFGIEIEGAVADKVVRSMKLSKDTPSILKEVIDSQKSIVKRMEESEGNKYIIENLGGSHPFESFAAPIIANGKVAVIVYCDNVPEDKEIGDASSLDVFLMQAGVAMERAVLERRVQEMSPA